MILCFQRRHYRTEEDWTESGEDDDDWRPGSATTKSPPANKKCRLLRRIRKKSVKYSNSFVSSDHIEADDSADDKYNEESLVIKSEPVDEEEKEPEQPILKKLLRAESTVSKDTVEPVKIKDEPSDKGYESVQNTLSRLETTSPSSFSPLPTPSTSTGSFSHAAVEQISPLIGEITNSPSTYKCDDSLIGRLRIVASQRHLATKIQTLERELQQSQEQNCQLRQDFSESQEQVKSLQGQLHNRDILLAQLAEDFFDLNNRFQALSKQFKTALAGTLQSNYNNNELAQ